MKVRICDRHGCDEPGDCPAPKSPTSKDRWYFCATHAAEYNRNWNYFEGLSEEEAKAREASERAEAAGYTASKHNGWAGPGDGSRSRDEMRALDLFELDADADFDAIKQAWGPQDDFDFDGVHIKLKRVRAKPKPYGGSRPLIMNAGSSGTGG